MARVTWQGGQRYVDGTCPTCNYWPCQPHCADREAELEQRTRAPRVPEDPYSTEPQREWKCPSCGKVPADGTITEQIEGGKVVLAYRLCRECEDPAYCFECGLVKEDPGSGERQCPQCELGWV